MTAIASAALSALFCGRWGVCKEKFVTGMRQLRLHVLSKLRRDAKLRYLFTGEQKPKGRKRKYARKLNQPKFVVLFSTDFDCCPKEMVRLYHLRFQIEFLFRDSKQFTGLEDCQSRTAKKLDFHFNASLSALNLAELQAWQERDPNQSFVFSMASIKRRVLNDFLLDVFISKLELSPALIKSHPNYESLRAYGLIAA